MQRLKNKLINRRLFSAGLKNQLSLHHFIFMIKKIRFTMKTPVKSQLIIVLMLSSVYMSAQTPLQPKAILSFEDLKFVSSTQMIEDINVPGCSTTSSDHKIEIWVDGTGNVKASDGKYFAEINGSENSALFFDVNTENYNRLNLSFDHRGRDNGGFDQLEVFAGNISNPLQSLGIFQTDNKEWKTYYIDIPIEKEQKITRIKFQAVSTAGGDPTKGNFIDNIRYECIRQKEVSGGNDLISLYPNPALNLIHIETRINPEPFYFKIFSLTSMIVRQGIIQPGSAIDIQNLSPGIYCLQLTGKSGTVLFQKNIIKL